MNKICLSKCTIFIFAAMSFFLVYTSCQNNSNDSNQLTKSKDSSSSWYSDGEWLHGLEITPNKTINRQEFSRQYHLKNTWWDEAFNFLKTHDLKTLVPGRYVIDSGNVFATVWEGVPNIKDSVLWEAHRDFNDLQYIISGKADMGITPIDDPNIKITAPYSKEEDIAHFTVRAGDQYYPADSSSFFIFSPKEMHRPAIQVDGDNLIKKIVIKVRVPQ
ncbi:MAG: YhcH/YjgK/YiaL family protein [Ginsengibacter sp.]